MPVSQSLNDAHDPDNTELCRASKGLSQTSIQAYAKDLRIFIDGGGQFPCDAEVLRRYLLKHRTLSPSTLYRRCQAVRYAHVSQRLPSPTADPTIHKAMRALHQGIVLDQKVFDAAAPGAGTRRKKPTSAAPISRTLVAKILEPLPRHAADRRDRALILILFGGALRRAEAIALNIEDIRFTPDALMVKVGNRQVAISATGGDLCGARACRELIERSGWDIEGTTGPLFRRAERGGALSEDRLDPGAVSLIIKRMVAAAGSDPARYSAESLRRGRLMEMARGRLG